jgi:nucleosome binding factor SPN SPT16 subunit
MAASPNIDPENFFAHHNKFLKKWKDTSDDLDAVLFLNGKDHDNKNKTTALSVWYFGYDFLDTLLVFTKT